MFKYVQLQRVTGSYEGVHSRDTYFDHSEAMAQGGVYLVCQLSRNSDGVCLLVVSDLFINNLIISDLALK